MLIPRLFIPPEVDSVTCKGITYAIAPDRTIQPLNEEHLEMLTGSGIRIADGQELSVEPVPETLASITEFEAEPDES